MNIKDLIAKGQVFWQQVLWKTIWYLSDWNKVYNNPELWKITIWNQGELKKVNSNWEIVNKVSFDNMVNQSVNVAELASKFNDNPSDFDKFMKAIKPKTWAWSIADISARDYAIQKGQWQQFEQGKNIEQILWKIMTYNDVYNYWKTEKNPFKAYYNSLDSFARNIDVKAFDDGLLNTFWIKSRYIPSSWSYDDFIKNGKYWTWWITADQTLITNKDKIRLLNLWWVEIPDYHLWNVLVWYWMWKKYNEIPETLGKILPAIFEWQRAEWTAKQNTMNWVWPKNVNDITKDESLDIYNYNLWYQLDNAIKQGKYIDIPWILSKWNNPQLEIWNTNIAKLWNYLWNKKDLMWKAEWILGINNN